MFASQRRHQDCSVVAGIDFQYSLGIGEAGLIVLLMKFKEIVDLFWVIKS